MVDVVKWHYGFYIVLYHSRCSEITIKGPKKQPETKLHMFGVHFWDL
jgi:hypothetical protein